MCAHHVHARRGQERRWREIRENKMVSPDGLGLVLEGVVFSPKIVSLGRYYSKGDRCQGILK